ncbi:MAG: hypothetical protein AB7P07_07225 [Hyphomonadaceae bacterium]
MDAQASSRAFQTAGPVWLRDFKFGRNGVTVRKTGALVPYSPSVLAEVTAWFRYFFAVRQIAPIGAPFTIAFTPERARPWYLIWAVARLAGAKLTQDFAHADVVMHFEDATFSPNPAPAQTRPDALLINFGCRDVSKTYIAQAFEDVFGYPLLVEPETHFGAAVNKSEINAAHDGHIVQCPVERQPNRCYQRVIDNRGADPTLVDDLRTATVGGRPAAVFIKRRPVTKRFQNTNVEVLLRTPEQVFTADELAKIAEYAQRIGLEWGGLDILRDRNDGRLYIVDANKTDMGPPIALNLPDKLTAARAIARAFRDYLDARWRRT